RLVVEPVWEHVSKIFDHRRAQQLRMNSGHAIRTVATDDGQVRHADLLDWHLFDQAHALCARIVAGEARLYLMEELAVDLIDDFQVPGYHQFKQSYGPFF